MIAGCPRWSRVDVDSIRFEQVIRHRLEALGPVDLQRHAPAWRPRREDQIGITHRVIGMQVRREYHSQVRRLRAASFALARRCARRTTPGPKSTSMPCCLRRRPLQAPIDPAWPPGSRSQEGQPSSGWTRAPAKVAQRRLLPSSRRAHRLPPARVSRGRSWSTQARLIVTGLATGPA